ncbi:hypothetical protein CANCADRAFT_30332 [Tortispora caseinolytica NRRL Y-17796]|uniref:Arrestin-like N-terminal domain-containing protein n=1 Tax=Tortispora caseinolytica NRRL Y-17796 TaxID=767744 RepID=A0A1E4TJY4_9ASCO|nr:hypothetical protein CANCADRAFT_30332 [Tortispora caseinolytica NRRL Y-17796]
MAPSKIRIELKENKKVWTCGDVMEGRVLLALNEQTEVARVSIKLEAECKTAIHQARNKLEYSVPSSRHRRRKHKREARELHRFVYESQQLFPTPDLITDKRTSSSSGFKLPVGEYSYNFSIKIPWHTDCSNDHGLFNRFTTHVGTDHIETILPPTLQDTPYSQINYYLKATASRPRFLQISLRGYHPFKFSPPDIIDEPRENSHMAFHHHFELPFTPSLRSNIKRMFFLERNGQKNRADYHVKVTLPDPPKFVVGKPLPDMVIQVTPSVEALLSSGQLTVKSFSMDLFAMNEVHADGYDENVLYEVSLLKMANLSSALYRVNSDEPNALRVPTLWRNTTLKEVPCSFKCCSVSRKYVLRISLGITSSVTNAPYSLKVDIPIFVAPSIPPSPHNTTLNSYMNNLEPYTNSRLKYRHEGKDPFLKITPAHSELCSGPPPKPFSPVIGNSIAQSSNNPGQHDGVPPPGSSRIDMSEELPSYGEIGSTRVVLDRNKEAS